MEKINLLRHYTVTSIMTTNTKSMETTNSPPRQCISTKPITTQKEELSKKNTATGCCKKKTKKEEMKKKN